MPEPISRRLPITLLLMAFGLAQLGFCLAVPAYRGIDEFDHAFRASSVGHGHVWAGSRVPDDGRGFLVPVEESIARAAFTACDDLSYTGPDNCTAVTQPNAAGEVDIASAAATYNPAWYVITGWGSRPFSGDTALYAMRVISILLVDLILLGALVLAGGARTRLWTIGGVMIAATPILAYSSTVAAPNGTTYAAALLLWVGLLRLREDGAPGRGTWWGIAVGACAILLTHSTGVLFVPAILACAAPLLWPRRRQLWRESRRPVVAVALTIAVVGMGCLAWILAAGTNDPRGTDADLGSMPIGTALIGPVLWFLQSIATLAFRNEPAPVAAYVLGATVIVTVLVLGARRAQRSERLSMASLVVVGTVIPITLTWLAYSTQGAAWQGRYGLPLTVGLILVAASAFGSAPEAGRLAPVLATLLVLVVATHALTLEAMVSSLNGPTSALQLAAIVIGGLGAAGLVVRATTLLSREVEVEVDA